jgi:glycosyltransferase involved in cell wall biosynthesis
MTKLLKKINNKKKSDSIYPTLTILMPTYNRERTVGRALSVFIDQIENSEFKKNIFILISENHSTDATQAILSSITNSKDYIRIIQPKQHLPTGEHNLFFSFKYVTTDFVWSFADDDEILPGTVDAVYKSLSRLDSEQIDFLLINASHKAVNGRSITNSILAMQSEDLIYDNYQDLFCSVGPCTLLASFSCSVFRLSRIEKVNFDNFLDLSPIYAHVFAYLFAFSDSKVLVLKNRWVSAVQTTHSDHWDRLGRRMGWYSLYPWSGGLIAHLLAARKNGLLSSDQISYVLNSNENGRYNLVKNIVVQFLNQLIKAIETLEDREIPPRSDFSSLRTLLVEVPFVHPQTIDFLQWGEMYFFDTISLIRSIAGDEREVLTPLSRKLQSLLDCEQYQLIKIMCREKLIHKIQKICQHYLNDYTYGGDSRPDMLYRDEINTIFRHASRFVLMRNEVYDINWAEFDVYLIDIESRAPDWFVFKSYKEAIASSSDQNIYLANSGSLHPFLDNDRWQSLLPAYETNGVDAIIKKFEDLRDYRLERKLISEIEDIGLTQMPEAREVRNLQIPIINPVWYVSRYERRVQKDEQRLLLSFPILHYLIAGQRRGWNLSPFIDEFFYKKQISLQSYRPRQSRSMDIEPEKSVLEDIVKNKKISISSPYFSEEFYCKQCEDKNIFPGHSPICHYVSTGYRLGLAPHELWDEALYIELNPDLKTALNLNELPGWVHWCMHGRFENRPSPFMSGAR